MVNEITKNSILKIKETVDAYEKEMVIVKEKINNIDEKYRKLAEKESKELRAAYSELEAEQEIWNSSLSRYDSDLVNEVLGTSSTVEDEPEALEVSTTVEETVEEPVVEEPVQEEEPEKVVDTIFPENNDEEDLPEDELEESVEESVEDAVEEPVDDWTEEVVEEVAEEAAVEEPKAENVIDTDEGWPEFPEEWK